MQIEEDYNYEIDVDDIDKSDNYHLNLDKLKAKHQSYYKRLINNPNKYLNELKEKLVYVFKKHDVKIAKDYIKIIVTGNLGGYNIAPQHLYSKYINKLISITGIVISVSNKKSKLIEAVQYSSKYNQFIVTEFPIEENILNNNNQNNLKSYDNNKNPLYFEYGKSKFVEYQIITVQDAPENIRPGQFSRTVEVIIVNDLCNVFKPGDKATFYGTIQIQQRKSNSILGIFRYLLNCLHGIKIIEKDNLSMRDIQNIRNISRLENPLKALATNYLSSISGNYYVKLAILLQQISCNTSTLNNIRSNIHILLLGDPATGKSQFLNSIKNINRVNLGIVGTGASGAGITSSVTIGKNNKKKINAGAIVLADSGVLTIDEMEKMNNNDIILLHEAMEQQTVTVNKAGFHMTLNCKTSILSACNSIYGSFNFNKTITENLGISEALINRFDLIFLMQDLEDISNDMKIAQKVLSNHRTICKNYYKQIFMEKYNDNYNYITNEEDYYANNKNVYISTTLIRKYIEHVRNLKVVLKEDSKQEINKKWLKLKTSTNKMGLNIGIRQLESLIRLSVAIAKFNVKEFVEIEHVELAYEIIDYSLNSYTDIRLKNTEDVEKENNIAKRNTDNKATNKEAEPIKELELQNIIYKEILSISNNRDFNVRNTRMNNILVLPVVEDHFLNLNGIKITKEELHKTLQSLQDRSLIYINKKENKLLIL